MIRSRKFGEWYKKYVWFPRFFRNEDTAFFVWFDYVEHRQILNCIGQVKNQYRPIQTNEDQCI